MLTFYSCLATKIQRFINLRRLSGTDYHSQALLLSYFDRFLAEKSYQGVVITRQIIDDYQSSVFALSPRTRNNRFCVVRQLCEYIATSEPQSYLPDSMKNISSRVAYKPYIYTPSDIHALMNVTARLTPIDSLRPHTICVLLGLLYASGIRIGEALALNIQNFYRDEERLFIADGKFHKARWIPLTVSTCTAVDAYIKKRCQYECDATDSPLFINLRQRRLQHRTVNHDFRLLLDWVGISQTKEHQPRLHDLRHTFAIQRLLRWYREGLDVNALLPALATYMGHVGIASTQIYLQPTTELLEQVNQRYHRYYLKQVQPAGDIS